MALAKYRPDLVPAPDTDTPCRYCGTTDADRGQAPRGTIACLDTAACLRRERDRGTRADR